MRIFANSLLVCLLALPLAGCLTGGRPSGATILSPSAGVDALGEGLIGRADNLKLPDDARRVALDAEFQALQFGPVGRPVLWAADGYRGEVTPTQLYRIGSQDCRGYTHSVVRGTQTSREVGTACRTEDNLWAPV